METFVSGGFSNLTEDDSGDYFNDFDFRVL